MTWPTARTVIHRSKEEKEEEEERGVRGAIAAVAAVADSVAERQRPEKRSERTKRESVRNGAGSQEPQFSPIFSWFIDGFSFFFPIYQRERARKKRERARNLWRWWDCERLGKRWIRDVGTGLIITWTGGPREPRRIPRWMTRHIAPCISPIPRCALSTVHICSTICPGRLGPGPCNNFSWIRE